MATSQDRPNRKQTGAKYVAFKKKRQNELGRQPSLTGLAAKRAQNIRTMGSNRKVRLLSEDVANLFDPKAKSYTKAKIKTILENPANRHFVRRNIMTKGTVIDTEKGKARVTSRPGQDGMVNAVLV
ncbi:30S ribosomal protein S8e [Candidatus Woesearchaeota archaeon]|nr:30S ribosomal protein S8e [Candidatus Woesearchaeota archaeon]